MDSMTDEQIDDHPMAHGYCPICKRIAAQAKRANALAAEVGGGCATNCC